MVEIEGETSVMPTKYEDYSPNWEMWAQVRIVELWGGILLSLNMDHTPSRYLVPAVAQRHKDRLRIAGGYLSVEGGFRAITLVPNHPERCKVLLSEFAAWACRMKWEVPDAFADIGKQARERARYENKEESSEPTPPETGNPSDKQPCPTSTWPWGEGFETPELQVLARTVCEWWLKCDKRKPHAAPTRAQIVEWLMEKEGLGSTAAKRIYSITRPEWVPTGPRANPPDPPDDS